MTGATAAPLLRMSHITRRFGATVALDDVSLHVHAGEVLALVGENGSGKSTLMKVLSGALKPDAGAMELAGAVHAPADPMQARRAGVAMIYQELSLAPHLSVMDNLMLGMEPTRYGFIRRRDALQQARHALERLQHPELDPGARVGSLSPAAQQLVEIARAMTMGCQVLVLDEPTSSLTQQDASMLFDLIDRLRAEGIAIIYITHYLEEVRRVASRMVVLCDGRNAGEGDPSQLTNEQIVQMMVGRTIEDFYPKHDRTRGDLCLEITGLAGRDLPRDASLQLYRGEVLGIAGLVGAGRTELLRCLFGLDPVRSGAIRVGAWTGPASPARRWSQSMGMLSEDRKNEGLALGMSIADNIMLSRLPLWINPRTQRREADRWVDALSIRCLSATQPVGALSGGNQQKAAVSRLLYHDVDVLLLDEPTRGIDVVSKAQIYTLIDRLACGDGAGPPRSVLMISSYLPELLGVCDRIAVMCRGHLSEARSVDEWTAQSLMLAATGGNG